MVEGIPVFVAAANRLRERRKSLGLGPSQVASRIGVSAARYRNWEKFFGSAPMRQYGDAIARILGVDTCWFSTGEGEFSVPETAASVESLGQRAAARRRSLQLSKAEVARAVGVTNLTLRKWEEALPTEHRREREDRWEAALSVPHGWLRDPALAAPPVLSSSSRPGLDLTPAALASVSEEIGAVAAWLARAGERARTARAENLSEAERRRATMFAQREMRPPL